MRVAPLASFVLFTASMAHAQGASSVWHARQLFEARNYEAARVEFTALSHSAPSDAMPPLYLGRIALAVNDNDEAVHEFERCVALDERNAECHLWLGNAIGMSAQHASKFRLPVLARRCKTEFERAVALDPNSVDARMGLVDYYMFAPGVMGGSMDKAREQVAEIDKRSTLRGAIGAGILADHEKRTKDAEASYQRAVALAPDSSVGYYSLANEFSREKKWPEAFATWDRLLQRFPWETNALLAVARAAYQSGEQLDKGEAAARKWLAAPPKDVGPTQQAIAHARLAGVYEKSGRKELARSEYERALVLNPRNEEARKALDALRN